MTRIISPSILSADFAHLYNDIQMVNESEAEWIHLDVMDGVFVPNISFGFPVVSAVKKHSRKWLDVHIMIVHPEKYVNRFAEAGANMLTFHYEAAQNPEKVIDSIRQTGMKVGITINPDVPVSVLEPYVSQVDMVLLMTVFAGYGGQKFIPESFQRIAELQTFIQKSNPQCLIQVDGGVTLENASALFNAGVNVLVAGSTVFNAENPKEVIYRLLRS